VTVRGFFDSVLSLLRFAYNDVEVCIVLKITLDKK